MLLLLRVCLLSCAAALVRADQPRPLEGEIDGAKYTIVAPVAPNGCVLIFCHGYRPEGPELTTDLVPLKSTYQELAQRGWVIAATSYRRNGLIVADGLADVLALRAEIARRFGEPRRVVLHGESMGGAIATLLLEREPKKFAGALAVGAALAIEEGGTKLEFTRRPGGPLLFLSNRTEAAPPRAYVEAATAAKAPAAAWTADRDGHLNVNQREVAAALAALNQWLDSGAAPEFHDDTLPAEPRPSTMILREGRGTAPMLQRITIYGNITLDFQSADFKQLGLARGDSFTLRGGAKSARVKLGQTYSDVARGEWVAFFDAEDRLLVAINRGNAADELGVKLGDLVSVEK